MKIRKPSMRSTSNVRGKSSEAVGSEVSVERLEQVEGVDQADRFEVGASGPAMEREEEETELEAELQAALEDPEFTRAVQWPVMIGTEALPAHVESSYTGVMTLLDTEEKT